MENNPKEYFEFDPNKLKKAKVSDVRPNTWNPKDPNDPDYEKVKESVLINGLTQPIFVRQNDNGETKYEILDGEHRWRSARDLGYEEIYIYDEGEVPDALAKSLTIWHEVGVKMQEADLAPLVVELNRLDFELPYSDDEIKDFENLVSFDFNNAFKDEEPEEELPNLKTLNIKMTSEQFEVVDNAIRTVSEGENVSDGRALELLCSSGLAGYPFDGTGDIELES